MTVDTYQLYNLYLFKGNYPDEIPLIILPRHLEAVGFRQHLLSSIEDLIGSPVLFQLLTAANEWIEAHPFSFNVTPTQATPSNEIPSNTEQPICKFFTMGTCKYGSKCRNYHPDSKTSTSVKQRSDRHDNPSDIKPQGNRTLSQMDDPDDSRSEKAEIKKSSMRTASDVISRILWDPDIKSEDCTIGYLDRFVGIIEKPFAAFSWEDIATVANNVLAIPKHRIQYFKFRDEIVWDKRTQTDNVFGSRGGKLIQDVIRDYKDTMPSQDGGKEASKAVVEVSSVSTSVRRGQQDRPTHFVCIRVTNEETLANVKKIQDHIVDQCPDLADACLPLTALHVTVCMVQLETASHFETVKTVLENCKRCFVQFLPRCASLIFSGVDNFRDRLLYAKVSPNPALDKFSSFLIESFKGAGLKTPGNHAKFTPHMTLVKMSRPMQRELHTIIINPAMYTHFSSMDIGKQYVKSIHICSMTEPKQIDGFYKQLHSITNSVANLSPLVPSIFAKYVSMLQKHGLMHEIEGAKLIKSLEMNTTLFDESIEAITKLVRDNSHLLNNPLGSRVIILRGLPGSGKSHLTKSCSERSIAICSADSYFDEAGSYKFIPSLLPKAHSQCYDSFLQALIDGKEVVIIDNTNSMMWEYRNYIYLCQLFGIKCNVLEIPHPDPHIIDTYCSRNLHGLDISSVKVFADRWEEDERAIMLPPSLVYPRVGNQGSSNISLLDLCNLGYLPDRLLASSPTLVPVYIGVFLTSKSQWKLVSFVPPSHPKIYADHVTLLFEPSIDDIKSTKVGKKVSIAVKTLADNSKVQAVTVQLPKGLHCCNKHPHITISTDECTHPKYSNDMLETIPGSTISDHLKLDGVIGVVVREALLVEVTSGHLLPFEEVSSSAEFYTILHKDYFFDNILHKNSSLKVSGKIKEDEAVSSSDFISICTGDQKITELYVFDFDGTLFETPDRLPGLQLYEKITGHKWPHKGWFGVPESLLPPLKIKPGPALADYRRHFGRAGSYTVILTARIERTESAVRRVLDNYQVCPDEIILKGQNISGKNPVFKVQIVSELQKKFPDLTTVKFWDDRIDNLEAMDAFSKTGSVKFEVINATHISSSMPTTPADSILDSESIVSNYLSTCGLLPTSEHTSAAQTGINFIASQFCSIAGLQGDPSSYTLVFGSHSLKRKSDVDLCLLSPPHLDSHECVDKLATQLGKCGVTHVHKGHGSRCPRLKVMLQFKESPPIDYDIVFSALSSADTLQTLVASSVVDPEELLSKVESQESKTALSGPILLHKVENIIDGFISSEVFGAVVEMVVQVLTVHRQKGNCYHCIHTFHIVQMLADYIDTHWSLDNIHCDTLFQEFIVHYGQLPTSKWLKRFEKSKCISPEYVIRVSELFNSLSGILQKNSIPFATRLEDVMTGPVFPPRGYTYVRLCYSGSKLALQWELQTVLETHLPPFIRQLLSRGIDVVPGRSDNQCLTFAVQDTEQSKKTVQEVFRQLWNHFSDYRNQKHVKLELEFGKKTIIKNEASSDVTENFASSELSELHLPASLSSYERLLVHETAERLGIKHKTIGEGIEKHIFLSK